MKTSYRLFAKIPSKTIGDPKGDFRMKFRESDWNEFGEYGDIEWTDFYDDGGGELGTSIRRETITEAIKFLETYGAYDFRILKTTTEEIGVW